MATKKIEIEISEEAYNRLLAYTKVQNYVAKKLNATVKNYRYNDKLTWKDVAEQELITALDNPNVQDEEWDMFNKELKRLKKKSQERAIMEATKRLATETPEQREERIMRHEAKFGKI
jgi:hypothetical protein